jgi:TPR repeat protein
MRDPLRSIRLDKDRVKQARRDKGLIQLTLAEKAGLELKTIKNAERGERVLIATARRIAAALDISLTYIRCPDQSVLPRSPAAKTIVDGVSDPNVQFETGYTLAHPPEGTEPNCMEALRWLTAAANQHHAEATFEIGELYRYNFEDFDLDEMEAFDQSQSWYRHAAQLNWPDAQFLVGQMCEWQYTAVGFREATRWFRKAALQGHAEAQFELAIRHLHGRAPRASKIEGVRLLTSAAESGYAPAEANLGWLRVKGHWVERNPSEGITLLRRAAAKDNKDAKFWLSKLYLTGQWVKKNVEHAYELLHSAAMGHHQESALFLAHDALNRTPPDWLTVYRWTTYAGGGYSKDHSHSAMSREARQLYLKAKRALTKEQLSEADLLMELHLTPLDGNKR